MGAQLLELSPAPQNSTPDLAGRWGMLDYLVRRLGLVHAARPVSEFLPFKETLKAAKAAGLSVGDYIDHRHSSGSCTPTDQTINGMAALGVFDSSPQLVCEIGPGCGRYLERVITRSHPAHYEIYETAEEWRDWLVEQHGVVAQKCDGRTLSETLSNSLDLVQAHKLFPALPFLITVSYLHEMARVVQPNGWIVFDILSESCLTPDYMKAWLEAQAWNWAWSPHLVTKEFVTQLFSSYNIALVGSFFVPLHPAVTECFVFRKSP